MRPWQRRPRRRGQHLDVERAHALWRQQWEIAWQTAGQLSWPEAKELQLEAADGRPLTVCFGHFWQPLTPAPALDYFNNVRWSGDGLLHSHGDGCGLVYPDSVSTLGRSPFRIYCPACSAKASERRQKAQSGSVAIAAGREQVVVGFDNGEPVLGWSGECGSCRETFVAKRPDVRRCERCRRGHR
jgi:hypothetical protein